MKTAIANKQNTITIDVWAIITKDMYEYGYDEPEVSFDEPWQADMPNNHCQKFTAEIPSYYQLSYDQSNGHQLLWDNKNQNLVFPLINHDMDTLRLATLDDDNWNDGKHNIVKCHLKPVQIK